MTEEIWKDIEGWPYHQVSNQGRVRVLPGGRVGRWHIATEIEIRKTSPNGDGYMHIAQGQLGKKTYHHIHILVLNAFYGPCPPGQMCRHLNGNPADNRWPENIMWGTREENENDKVRHGTSNRGDQRGCAKLTEFDVSSIKAEPQYYGIITHLAIKYKVARGTIRAIRDGRTWKTLSEKQ